MMAAEWSDEHEAFRGAVREFVARDLDSRYAEFVTNRRFSREIWQLAGKQGFLGLGVPEKDGGSGAEDWIYNMILGEELAAYSLAANSCFAIHYDVVAPYLVELTSQEQRSRWLPAFCSGDMVTAIGMTEPGGGTDLAGLRTRAERDGDHWIIDGSKTFITNGSSADLVLLAVRTDSSKGNKGISLIAVEADTPGFSRGRKLDKIGQPESDTAELYFSQMRVPYENLLGEEGAGFGYMMARLTQERLSASAANLAHAASALEETIEYARTRQAFGQSIGSFQALKFRLAEMVTEIDVTRAYVYQCARRYVEGTLSSTDAAKAKWWSSHVQNRVLDECVQIFGGYGYMEEYRVARAWRDARVTRIWAGTNEIMMELVGRSLGL